MTAIPDPPWRDSTDGGEAERYREVLRALESATGRVAARLELRWEKGDDDTLRKAVMVCTAATREEEQALARLAIMVMVGDTKYHLDNPQPETAEIGARGVRDPGNPCEEYEPDKINPVPHECPGDGHYLCAECARRKEVAP